jgi:hypothetical protein
MKNVPPEILALPLHERALMAFREAVQEEIESHIRAGLPMYIWRDGQVVALSPEELRSLSKP